MWKLYLNLDSFLFCNLYLRLVSLLVRGAGGEESTYPFPFLCAILDGFGD